jgi:2,4-diketo-3-deoxy-L-fuconate hydrolase
MPPVLVNVSAAGCAPFPALLQADRVLALTHWKETSLRHAVSMAALLQDWELHASTLARLCSERSSCDAIATHGAPVEALRVHAPIAPRQVYCTIGNYRSQLVEAALDAGDGPLGAGAAARRDATLAAIETRRREGAPYVCLKGSSCVAGPYDTLRVAGDLDTLDWEAEIGVVIGRSAWHVDRGSALQHVAGYCVVNDVTLRERVFRKDPALLGTDWLQCKARPGWLPAGPWLAPSWNVPNPGHLRPWLRLNGVTMQSGSASDMVFDIAEQIAYLSQHTRLKPGDLICSGSPAGFGSHHGRYLRPGDIVEAGVEGLGAQRVHCIS